MLKGSLAPGGAVLKVAGVPEHLKVFKGIAKVFDIEEEAWKMSSAEKLKKMKY